MKIEGDMSLEPRSRCWSLLDYERCWKGKGLRVAEDGFRMEGSLGRTSLRKSDVADADRS